MSNINLITIVSYCSVAIYIGSLFYLFMSIFQVLRHKTKRASLTPDKDLKQEPATLLKPVYGLDAEMLENLRSFCRQDYSEYQIIFGVQKPDDPAIPVIEQIIDEFPELDLELVIDQRLYGSNHKISNLINMLGKAKYDFLVISDSDMRVKKDYLKRVIAPFANKKIGAVTCLYSGSSTGNIASTLNAMFINQWFLPSVLISNSIQETRFCLGATMAVRRSIVDEMGGFEALKDHLADDYMLGKYVTDQGYKIHLCPMTVENIIEEKSFKNLISHELRWARTLKTVEPISYIFTFFTDTLVMSLIAGLLLFLSSGQWLLPLCILFFTFITRIFLHLSVKSALDSDQLGSIWLIPLRDFLSFAIRMGSFLGNSIEWRDHHFSVDQLGLIHNGAIEDSSDSKHTGEISDDLATSQDY